MELARIAPGTSEFHTAEGASSTRFWSVATLTQHVPLRAEDAVDRAGHLVESAVRGDLEASLKPSISLSGGVDSQWVASEILRQRNDQELCSFTAVPVAEWAAQTGDAFCTDETFSVRELAVLYRDPWPAGISPGCIESARSRASQ